MMRNSVFLLLVAAILILFLAACGGDDSQELPVIEIDPSWLDYGDAPDGGQTGYASGAELGNFPTRPESGGPQHQASGLFTLGESISIEGEPANGNDALDDGVLFLDVKACAESSVLLLINISGLTRDARQQPLYLNLLFDWDRDGTWQGGDACAQEWAVQNLQVDLSDWEEDTAFVMAVPEFIAGEQTEEFWYRVIITREPLEQAFGSFAEGETEDYLHRPELVFASRSGTTFDRPTQPTFTCVAKNPIISHGSATLEFEVRQTVESRSRIISLDDEDEEENNFAVTNAPPVLGFVPERAKDVTTGRGLASTTRVNEGRRQGLVNTDITIPIT